MSVIPSVSSNVIGLAESVSTPQVRTRERIDTRRHFMFYDEGASTPKGGVCVYAWHDLNKSWFNLATAVCSDGDSYSKKIANKLVQEAIDRGEFIKLPILDFHRKHLLPVELKYMVDNLFVANGFLSGMIPFVFKD